MGRPSDFPVEPGWQVLLKDLGIVASDVLRRATLPEDLFSRPRATLKTDEYFRFWRAIEEEVNDPLFPLRLGQAVTTEFFYPPIFAAMCSPNMLIAMQRLSHYKRLVAPQALHVTEETGVVSLSCEWLDGTVNPPPSLVAAELTFIVQLARIGTRELIKPLQVVSDIPVEPLDEYERFFGCSVRQGNQAAVVFSEVDALRPFLTANESMWRTFEPELRRRLADLDASATIADRVRAALLELLPSGQASMDAVLKKLALSKRTLQRRLQGENTSFQEVLSATREALARHYVGTTSLSGAEISFLLGFEDPNSFFRAFNDWTGTTPERMRREFTGVH
ncbi:MAG: AraC family transcriptional regulator [Proteobacteria bacterium]|nr:AraC family transcriptional regulator [Pseudomonadota bacterium]